MSDSAVAPNIETHSEREFTSQLILLYRNHPVLWNVKCDDYFNRNKRSAAIENIVCALRAFKPDYTIYKFKQKINTLRTNFNREYKAIEEKRASGAASSILEPTLWYYNELYFIRDPTESSATETTEVKPVIFDGPDFKPKFPSQTSATKKWKGEPDSTEQLADHRTMTEEEDVLAKYWAMKLRKLRPNQRRFAEKIVNDTLFEAEMGTLSRKGVTFLPHTDWQQSLPSTSTKEDWQHFAPSAEPVYSDSENE